MAGVWSWAVKRLGREMLILDEQKRILDTKGKSFRLEIIKYFDILWEVYETVVERSHVARPSGFKFHPATYLL